MTELFVEKAFWFVAALVFSLIAVIYRLFNSTIQKDLKLLRNGLKDELREELKKYFDLRFANDINNIETNISELKIALESLKRHDDNNSEYQVRLLQGLIDKMDKIKNEK